MNLADRIRVAKLNRLVNVELGNITPAIRGIHHTKAQVAEATARVLAKRPGLKKP